MPISVGIGVSLMGGFCEHPIALHLIKPYLTCHYLLACLFKLDDVMP